MAGPCSAGRRSLPISLHGLRVSFGLTIRGACSSAAAIPVEASARSLSKIHGIVTVYLRGGSSAGRASRSQCEGREFDPPPLHQYTKVNSSLLAFFLARSRVFAGTPADSCGLPSSGRLAHLGPISLSPGHSSLQPRSPAKGRSPQRPQRGPIQINGLRADESNGWIAASAGKGNHGRCVLSVVLDSYRRFATL